MTVGWAIVVVAILYLLDKYNQLKKALVVAAILTAAVLAGYAGLYSWVFLKGRWDSHQFAKIHECLDPSTANVHAVDDSEPWCSVNEVVREHVTIDPKSIQPLQAKAGDPLSILGTIYTLGESLTIGKNSVPDNIFMPVPPPPPPRPPGGGESVPVVSGSEFLFRRLGSKEYSKAICYNESTQQASSLIGLNHEKTCTDGEILMEEVR
jgi:hypothetical protein